MKETCVEICGIDSLEVEFLEEQLTENNIYFETFEEPRAENYYNVEIYPATVEQIIITNKITSQL